MLEAECDFLGKPLHGGIQGEPVDPTDQDSVLWELILTTQTGPDTRCHWYIYTYKLDAEVCARTLLRAPKALYHILSKSEASSPKTRLKHRHEKTRSTANSLGQITPSHSDEESLLRPPCLWHSTVKQAAVQRSVFLTSKTR